MKKSILQKLWLVLSALKSIQKDSEHYLMQHHHISDETGFRLSFCELKVFGSGILMLYHMITGKELTINDLWQKNGIRKQIL